MFQSSISGIPQITLRKFSENELSADLSTDKDFLKVCPNNSSFELRQNGPNIGEFGQASQTLGRTFAIRL